nr:UBX domain-containing protein 1 [Ciona intestinalis]|eukprot:XP_002121999.1 UBX domain-containing protein 1 [Ciona intestinalis]
MSGVETLVEMGFLRNRAEKAWLKMGDRGVQAAMEWLLEHNEDPDIDEPYQPPQGRTLTSENESSTSLDTQPSSQGDVAEAKPVLTEEEREERLKQIQEKIKQRRQESEAEEKKRQIEAEIQRRKSGQDISKIKADIQWKEAQKQAEARKREKREDMIARQRVKEQIAMDRAEKLAREEKEKQERMQASPGVSASNTATAATSVTSIKKEHTHARLQIRLPNGGTLVEKFSAKEQLSAVKLYIELNRKDGDVTPFMLITAFPKKRFTEEEMNMSLESLDLAPSAVLTVVNKVQ